MNPENKLVTVLPIVMVVPQQITEMFSKISNKKKILSIDT